MIILITTILIVVSIIFFTFILPKIKGQNVTCSSCPTVKKAKRLVKEYKQENRKDA